MFKSDKKNAQGLKPFTLDALASHLDASYGDVNDKLTAFFNALTLENISESVLGQKCIKMNALNFTHRPSTDFCLQTDAYKKYAEFLQGAQVELSHFEVSTYDGEISIKFSVANDFFSSKAEPVALLDAPKADALSDDLTQSIIVIASQKKEPAII
jgi:hypothetical protein